MPAQPPSADVSYSEEEKTEINRQLERLLGNPHFSHSRRFPSFLRFVVDHTLSGQTDLLKERTIGIEIFGRDADYDTSSDPIVRVTATEIRKRIAQYYQEPGHETELRLSLPSGSYIPQFHWPESAKGNGVAQLALIPAPVAPVPDETPLAVTVVPPKRMNWRPVVALAALLVLLGGGGA